MDTPPSFSTLPSASKSVDPSHKYVRHDFLGFILWPRTDMLAHADIGRCMLRVAGGRLLSAGFCYVFDDGVRCFGRSGSLNLNSLPEDSAALAKQLGLA